MKLQLQEKETCPNCGARFDCGKSGKCWCYEVNIDISVLEKLEKEFSSCLCPVCLASFQKENLHS